MLAAARTVLLLEVEIEDEAAAETVATAAAQLNVRCGCMLVGAGSDGSQFAAVESSVRVDCAAASSGRAKLVVA
jgi:hypothetical protein